MENRQTVKNLFHEAVEIALSERKSFLDRNCADSEVRFEVESLLEAYQQAADFIASPVFLDAEILPTNFVNEFADENDDDFDRAGEKVGNYEIVREIGRGGMGAVYLAQRANDDFVQQVAVKIVKRGMDTDFVVKRFRQERRILASLNHPNIAKLFEGGTTRDGLPYFVMEYVNGENLLSFCSRKNLQLAARLTLFREVCAALIYAHQNLVVNRDLKPSNILITPEGVPKLLDFGIAKLLTDDETVSNTTGIYRLLTPEYASPEQVRGERITTASDVYSLGVLLYELLTAHSPYRTQSKSFQEIIRAVCETEPPKPSEATFFKSNKTQTENANETRRDANGNSKFKIQNSKSLSGDLDNIVLKALQKEPLRRYASVQEFSEDIRRYLSGLPVLARPQTLKYRFEKYIKRHRAGVFAAALITFSLVAGASVAAWQTVEARRERARAERRFDDVRGLANTILFDHYERIKNLPGATEARAKLVSDALQYLDKLAQESFDKPDLQRELVTAYRKLGEIQGSTSDGGNLGDENAARENYLKALAIQETLAANNSSVEDQRSLGKIYLDVSYSFDKENERPTQAEYVAKGLQIFRVLQTTNPKTTEREADLANALWTQANIVRLQGDNDGAIETYVQAAEIYETLGRGGENAARYRRNAALTYKNIGAIYAVKKDFSKALEFYEKAFDFDKENAVRAPENVETQMDLSFTHRSLGEAFYHLNDKGKTLGEYQSAIAIQEKVYAADAKNRFAAKSLARSYLNIADVYRDDGDLTQAETHYQKCRAMLGGDAGKEGTTSDKLQTANFYWSYGDFYLKKAFQEKPSNNNDLKSALEKLTEAKNIYQTLQNQNVLDPAYLENIGQINQSLDKVISALTGASHN